MNIILFTSSTTRSGGSRQALYLAQGLAERGHSVTFFVPEGSSLQQLAPQWPHWGILGKKRTWRATIEATMPKDNSPCVVHAFHNAAVKRAAWWGIFWRKRAVVVAHRGVVFRPNNPLPYWSPGMDAFLVNSQGCADVLHRIGVGKKRLYVVPNCVPDARITPLVPREQLRTSFGFSPNDIVFGTVAGNSPVKGVDVLVRAFARIVGLSTQKAEHNTSSVASTLTVPRLLLIGVSDQWLAVCAELGISDYVQMVKHTEDVASHLAAMDVFVLPSLSESMPNTLLEAVRVGLPCIGTQVGAVPEILKDCGIVVPAGDVAALGEAMTSLYVDAQSRNRLREAAQLQGMRYSPHVRLDMVEGIYSHFLQRFL